MEKNKAAWLVSLKADNLRLTLYSVSLNTRRRIMARAARQPEMKPIR